MKTWPGVKAGISISPVPVTLESQTKLMWLMLATLFIANWTGATEPWQDLLARADESAARGNTGESIDLARTALDLVEGAPVPCDTCAARVYQNLGRYYFFTDLAAAEYCYAQALALRERSLDPAAPDLATSQSNLGRVYVQQGRHAEAQALFRKALAIQKRNYGPVGRGVARTLNSLGDLCRVLCDYHESERCYQDALVACQGWTGADSVAAMIHNNMGVLYQEEGRRTEAEYQYLQALDLYDSAACREPLRIATVVNNLARLWHEAGRYDDAERLYLQAHGIFKKYAGDFSPDVARSLNNLAYLWIQTGELDRAESALNEAMTIQRATFGARHPALAASINNLAFVEIARGNFAAARVTMQRAIAINEAIGSSQDRSLAENMRGLAEISLGQGDHAGAGRYARRAFELSTAAFHRGLATFIERVAILNSLHVKSDAAFYISTLLEPPHASVANAEAIASAVLNTKGIITDVMAARTWGVMNSVYISASKDSLDEITREIQALRETDGSGTSPDLQRLYLRRDRFEAQIARRQSLIAERHGIQSISTDQATAAVPENGFLVEYFRYRHRTGLKTAESRYIALVLGGSQAPRVVELGLADSIDALVAHYRAYFESPRARDANSFAGLSTRLYDAVWRPIAPLLQGKPMVVIAPDGQLNLISFAGLRDDAGDYVIEQHSVHYCGSGRDLLHRADDAESGYGLLAMGDPVFRGPTPDDKAASRKTGRGTSASLASRATGEVRLAPKLETLVRLPGTRKEVSSVCELWQQASVEPMTLCFGTDASEFAFRRLSSGKRIVYLATHGFSLASNGAPMADTRLWNDDDPHYIGDNPLAQSGLALAPGFGAKVQSGNDVAANECDGLLLAEDIASLDLMSAELVVLSACETGLGAVVSGEGVYGLRRAMLIAGARTVISTLWSVDDEATSALMSQFFAGRRSNIPEMLQAVQIEQLRKARDEGALDDPFKWGPFVVTGAWDWR